MIYGCNMDKHINIRKKAAAIKYNPDEAAPKVIAKGAGMVAEKILEKGKASNIKIYEDALLVEDLSCLDIGEQIPEDLYTAVAQILVFINELDAKSNKKYS